MKIDNSIKPIVGKPAEESHPAPANGKPTNGQATTGAENPGVSVDLSPLSSKLQSVEASSNTSEAANPARVDEIRQAISDGRFKVNPEVVADRLLATVQELIRAYRA